MTEGTHGMDQLREHAKLTESGVGVCQLVNVRYWVHAVIKSISCACDIYHSVAYIHAFNVYTGVDNALGCVKLIRLLWLKCSVTVTDYFLLRTFELERSPSILFVFKYIVP